MLSFASKVRSLELDLSPVSVETLQVNITKLCNQACRHCHVDSSPKRREMMSEAHIQKVLGILAAHPEIKTLDITGGAPELHPGFRNLVASARALGKTVMVRHNLTVTFDPHPVTGESMEGLPEFFARERVEVVSSLPYYREFLTDKQRGTGVFQKSIRGLQLLNERGYGVDPELRLNLVYNPAGHYLPGPEALLEAEYKRELEKSYGIKFNQLFAITNMPVHRFKEDLLRSSHYEEYMERLHAAFNPDAARGIMCRSLISVSYDGKLYDCDFNQMLGLEVSGAQGTLTIDSFHLDELLRRKIIFGDHCYGCTAGAGSSCGGTTAG